MRCEPIYSSTGVTVRALRRHPSGAGGPKDPREPQEDQHDSTRPLSLSGLLALGACDDKGATEDGTPNADTGALADPGSVDEDQDGYSADEDCDDSDGTINPAATEICDNVDNDCDGEVDEEVKTTFYRDADSDGFGDIDVPTEACEIPTGYVPNANDCDDTQATAFPGNTEVCDGIDNDCDTLVDEDVTTAFYADSDSDGFGDLHVQTDACTQPPGTVTDNSDCDDTTAAAFPGNLEVCDEIDNNCDGTVDEGVTTTYYADLDTDGFGDPGLTQEACSCPSATPRPPATATTRSPPPSPAPTSTATATTTTATGPSMRTTRWTSPPGTPTPTATASATPRRPTSIATSPPATSPTAPTATTPRPTPSPATPTSTATATTTTDVTVDEDDSVDAATWYEDADSDTYGDPSATDVTCYQPSGYVADNTDCDDTYAGSYPGADEYCDSRDNDCDSQVDEDGEVVDGDLFYADSDSDSTGDPEATIVACTQPPGFVDNAYDCNDLDSSEPVVVDRALGSSGGAGTDVQPARPPGRRRQRQRVRHRLRGHLRGVRRGELQHRHLGCRGGRPDPHRPGRRAL